jgi:ribonuclease III
LLVEASNRVISHVERYDPKSTLQEWAQSNKLGTPRYTTVASSGPDHARVFTVEVQVNGKVFGRGEGTSKQVAAQAAAQAALESLDML